MSRPVKQSSSRKHSNRSSFDIDNGYFPESPEVNNPCESIYSTESLINRFPISDNYVQYNEILQKLVERKSHSLSPSSNNSSYEEWTRSQDDVVAAKAATKSLEDVLKSRISFTHDNSVKTKKWKTQDVLNYLTACRSQGLGSFSPMSSHTTSPTTTKTVNPVVLVAKVKEKKSNSQKTHKEKGSTKTPKSHHTSKSKSRSHSTRDGSQDGLLKDPVFPRKYKPTYKLSNFDYIKRGWTKLPDYSITYRCVTLGAEPAMPELWPFRERPDGRIDHYPGTNKEAGNFYGGLPYYIYYPNGEVAISINEGRAGPRMIVYSMSKKDESGRKVDSRPQAMFDAKGNGVVWDSDGRMKMNYDQIEGALYYNYNKARPVLHWYWKESTYLRMRRADLDGLAPDHNDDLDPNRPDHGSARSGSSKRSQKSKKSGKRKSRSAGKRKSKAGGSRKSKVGGRKSKVGGKRKSKVSSERKSKTGGTQKTPDKKKNKTPNKGKSDKSSERKSTTARRKSRKSTSGKRKSKVGKKGKSKTTRKFSKKRATRSDVPPLRKKPAKLKPITEVAPIPVKITDYVSMRILNQQHIHLDFDCGPIHYRFYLGVKIKPEIVERIDKVVHPKRVSNITPCIFELMPLRSLSLWNVNQKLKEVRKDAARRAFNRSVKTIAGFYSWWHKKKLVKFGKGGSPVLPLAQKSALKPK
ncbi:hypothetical protein GE061_009248 [Apolygus lucorum]|uniref:Uncharacterized protein n=1 Tax=Apolygus lucorum TaxID=248454 RepID=A0A8S9Y3R6_APOLU|nr:hypothetical protein GE061_009248 [Apolygus lucorum]